MNTTGRILIYKTDDGLIKLEVEHKDGSVWLTQTQISQLYGRERSVITKHINNIFEEGEVDQKSNVQNMHIANSDKPVSLYSLDVIIAVGYRTKSPRATQFRQWATGILHEYLQKGFTMNDDLLKQAGGGGYFDELLARIRDIRASEKVFYRKVLDIYATSIDYDSKAESTRLFFKTVQNKMHYAVHGQTAAELMHERADGDKPFSGMSTWRGEIPVESDAVVAKNYLMRDEIDTLNRIVMLYLEFAELQAKEQIPMYMKDWLERLDDFLRVSRKDLLTHAGKISHEIAEMKALSEFSKYKERMLNELTPIEKHFLESIENKQKEIEGHK